MVRPSDRQPGGSPRSVAADEIGDVAEAQANQVGCGQRRAVAAVTDQHQRLIERSHGRVEVSVGRVEVPLDNGAWHVDCTWDDPETLAIGVGASVENQRSVAGAHPLSEPVGRQSGDGGAGLEQEIVHRRTVAASVERQCRHLQRVRPEQVQIVRPEAVAEHGRRSLVQDDEMAAAIEVLHRCVHERSAVSIIGAREKVGADNHEIEATLELQRDGVVDAGVGDVSGVESERIDQRDIVVAEVQNRVAREVGELIDERVLEGVPLHGRSIHVVDGTPRATGRRSLPAKLSRNWTECSFAPVMLGRMTTRAGVQQRAQGYTIGGVRILAGLMWLANLHWKVPSDFGESNGRGLYKYIAAGAENAPLAPYRWVLRELVLPNFQAFGWFTLISETIVAALLLIGYRSRWVALAGVALAVPIGLSVLYYPEADEWAWAYLLMIGLHLLLWAVPSGDHLGVDGVLAGPPERSNRALRSTGIVAVVVGVLGLFVARSIDFSGRAVALLGSDAGFRDAARDGAITRRWELKFLFFNPLWAVLTIAFGVLLILGSRKVVLGYAAAGGFAALALLVFFQQTFDYLRDDGAVQKIATGTNVAFWGGLALASALFARRASAVVVVVPPAE